MKIRMLSARLGSPDGVSLARYSVGEEYDLARTERERDLAAVFVREGWAVEAVAVEAEASSRAAGSVVEPAQEAKVVIPASRKRKG